MQRTFFQWLSLMGGKFPELLTAYAIPNGGSRGKTEARKFKAEGVVAGVWDVHLPIISYVRHGSITDDPMSGRFHGMWIEFKVKPDKLSKAQIEFRERMVEHSNHYLPDPFYSWEEAAKSVCWYLGINPSSVMLF